MLFDELKKIGNLEFVLHRMLNSVQIALLLANKDGDIVYANYCAEQLFGFDQLSFVGMKVEELLPERFREKHIHYRDEYVQIPKSRSMGTGRELFGLRIDKTEFPIEVGLTPLRMVSGLYVLVAVVDVTERELIRERLEHEMENNTNLNVINDQLNEFSHMVSHDLNNPLMKIERVIGKLVKYIKNNNEIPAEILENIDVLFESVQKSKALINDLLAFARTAHINLIEIDCDEFVKELVRSYFDAEDAAIKIIDLPKTKADPILLRHIFLNLISNSVKYNDKEEKLIEIGFSKNEFYVKDNGIGIPKEDIGKLFKPFTKISDDRSGTGIGLSICKKAVERHGGSMWVKSEETVGTTVFFTL